MFYYTSLLCLPHYLHAHILALSVLLLCSVGHVHSMHYSSSLYFSYYTMPPACLNHSQQPLISSLFYVFIFFMHLLHPLFTMLLHSLPTSSALPDHHSNSSASLAVKPMRPSSLGVMPRFLHLSSSREYSSSLEITHKSRRVLSKKPSVVSTSYSTNLEMEPSYASSFHLRDH